jgi:twitching motility protein PilT
MDNSQFDLLLGAAVKSVASDIHIKTGAPVMIREGNNLTPVTDNPLTSDDLEQLSLRILAPHAKRSGSPFNPDNLHSLTDLDTSYAIPGIGRFRVNLCRQRGTLAIVMRVIPFNVPDIDQMHLPEVIKDIAMEPRGLILVTGTTSCGKSTTLAAMIDHVNKARACKIITIEDPIEYLIPDRRSSLTQREVGGDSDSFSTALRAALRQDCDIIMVGEMRDRETIDIALKAAETGHLVMSTVHTPDAEGSLFRLLGAYDPGEHTVIRMRLCDCLRAIVSQRLVPLKDEEGRVAAVEIMRMTTAIKERILDADSRGFHDLIEQGGNPFRMQTFDQHLTELYKKGLIALDTALAAASSPVNFKRNLQFEG